MLQIPLRHLNLTDHPEGYLPAAAQENQIFIVPVPGSFLTELNFHIKGNAPVDNRKETEDDENL